MTAKPPTAFFDQIAQTNLQLFSQMHRRGYADTEMMQVAHAYRLATELFANRFRACGKPFVSHLVGTSAVLAWLGAPLHVVIAGLLHAAYQEGDFRGALPGITPGKRVQLQRTIGEHAEALVAAYTMGSRNLAGIRASHAGFKQLSEFDRTVLLMQLANELDDYRDLAALHARNAADRLEKISLCGEQQAEMAEWLGYPAFARALRATFKESLDASVAPDLQSDYANGYTIMPASCRASLTNLSLRGQRKIKKLASRLREKFYSIIATCFESKAE